MPFGRASVEAVLGISLRSCFSVLPLFAGNRRIWRTTGALVFEIFSFTTMLGFDCSVLTASEVGDFSLSESDRGRFSGLGEALEF